MLVNICVLGSANQMPSWHGHSATWSLPTCCSAASFFFSLYLPHEHSSCQWTNVSLQKVSVKRVYNIVYQLASDYCLHFPLQGPLLGTKCFIRRVFRVFSCNTDYCLLENKLNVGCAKVCLLIELVCFIRAHLASFCCSSTPKVSYMVHMDQKTAYLYLLKQHLQMSLVS
ncbi:hypothetical protein LRAMOSA09446 [Lichtheimia ramosa]|uniref:Uncharacterized protein n=1 Tax=Lichtheimia ramosa TaxID=688394 RepID=A0A077WIM5_9FUNG|nr:hypothetical protein LRAMOSA09446 [Lichtheimia ramosa]